MKRNIFTNPRQKRIADCTSAGSRSTNTADWFYGSLAACLQKYISRVRTAGWYNPRIITDTRAPSTQIFVDIHTYIHVLLSLALFLYLRCIRNRGPLSKFRRNNCPWQSHWRKTCWGSHDAPVRIKMIESMWELFNKARGNKVCVMLKYAYAENEKFFIAVRVPTVLFYCVFYYLIKVIVFTCCRINWVEIVRRFIVFFSFIEVFYFCNKYRSLSFESQEWKDVSTLFPVYRATIKATLDNIREIRNKWQEKEKYLDYVA